MYPDRVAVKNKSIVDYAELNRSVNQLAQSIVQEAVKGNKPWPSSWITAPMLSPMLAIWKAGKIYVPLDPGLPTAGTGRFLRTRSVPHRDQ